MDIIARLSRAIGAQVSSNPPDNGGGDLDKASEPRAKLAASPSANKRAGTSKAGTSAAVSFRNNWLAIRSSLLTPDQAALHHGVSRTNIPTRLHDLCDTLVFESNRADDDNEMAGPCMEMLLEGDLLGQLVQLSANDRVAGSQAEVVRLFASLIILLDEKFLSRQAVHRPLVRLMRICVGDEFYTPEVLHGEDVEDPNEDEERKAWRRFGRNGSAELLGFEEELVDLMCHVASRLRNTPELLIIFFRDRSQDADARRAFDAAVSGTDSRNSTRPSSPASSATSGSTLKAHSPLVPPHAIKNHTKMQKTPSNDSRGGQMNLTYDFPLFSYLLRFIHRESRTGELARAGLLFLVDVALAPGRRNLTRPRSNGRAPLRGRGTHRGRGVISRASVRMDVDFGSGPSIALARYMLESDFTEVLGAGLGAVYGLLPGKLALVKQPQESKGLNNVNVGDDMRNSEGMSLSTSNDDVRGFEESDRLAQLGIEKSTSEDVRRQTRLLADLLEFTQDILRTSSRVAREKGHGIGKDGKMATELASIARGLTKSIGSAVQTLFLRNILYPSLLECSDSDGSSVAVMSYLDVMLSVIEDDGPLAGFIIGWLAGEEEDGEQESTRARTDKPKRKSTAMLQIESEARSNSAAEGGINYFSEALGRYALKDLIKDHISPSGSPASMTAALRLANTLVTFHGRFAISSFLDVLPDEIATAFPSNLLAAELASSLNSASREGSNSDDSEDFLYPGSAKEEGVMHERLNRLPKIAPGSVSVAQHAMEMDLYLSLVASIEHGPNAADQEKESSFSSTGFENYLTDAEEGIMRDSLYLDGMSAMGNYLEASRSSDDHSDHPAQERDALSGMTEDKSMPLKHKLNPRDHVLRTILAGFARFFEHPPEVNVALTGLITSLILCPCRSLEGLLTFSGTSSQEVALDATEIAADISRNRPAFDEDDDRSDEEIERSMHKPSKVWPPRRSGGLKSKSGATSKGDGKVEKQSAPIVLAILRSLANQVEYHRAEIADFDRFLSERRRGLLYVENLNEALNLGAIIDDDMEKEDSFEGKLKPSLIIPSNDISAQRLWELVGAENPVLDDERPKRSSVTKKRISLPPPPSATPSQGMTNEQSSSSNDHGMDGQSISEEGIAPKKREGFARFFGRSSLGKKTDGTVRNESEAGPVSSPQPPPAPVMPFAQHYEQTKAILIEPRMAKISKKSLWGGAEKDGGGTALSEEENGSKVKSEKRTRFLSEGGLGDEEGEEFRYPGADTDSEDEEEAESMRKSGHKEKLVSLSSLLDNVVVLEEAIKEFVAIIQVRRAWGIDTIRFL